MNKNDYLKQVFSLDLSYQSEKLIGARQEFLTGNKQALSSQKIEQRRESYWSLQEFRDEFWSLSEKEREKRIHEILQNASFEMLESLTHLQQVSGLEAEIKKLEEDLQFDPVFVERLKSRVLWRDAAIPSALELRSAVAANTQVEFRQIRKSVGTLQKKYPEVARFIPHWLKMIETSEMVLCDEWKANQWEKTSVKTPDELVRTESKSPQHAQDLQEKKREEQGCSPVVGVLFLVYLIMKLLVFMN